MLISHARSCCTSFVRKWRICAAARIATIASRGVSRKCAAEPDQKAAIL